MLCDATDCGNPFGRFKNKLGGSPCSYLHRMKEAAECYAGKPHDLNNMLIWMTHYSLRWFRNMSVCRGTLLRERETFENTIRKNSGTRNDKLFHYDGNTSSIAMHVGCFSSGSGLSWLACGLNLRKHILQYSIFYRTIQCSRMITTSIQYLACLT